MSRTDELRQRGARDRTGGGGGAPFVKWPKGSEEAWVEGVVEDHWTGKYGDAVTLRVTDASPGLQASGKNEAGQEVRETVKQGSEVNVGLNYSALEGSIRPEDKGGHFHVAFEGWEESRSGDQYRSFAVLEVPQAQDRARPGENVPTSEEVQQQGARGTGMEPQADDDLPF